MKTICKRECNRCLIQLAVLGWCWLPCNEHDQVNHICIMSWSFGTFSYEHSTRASRTPLMSTHASYRLAGERGGTRGARGDSGAGTSGSTRTQRGATGVSGSSAQHVWERQAPEHSKPPYFSLTYTIYYACSIILHLGDRSWLIPLMHWYSLISPLVYLPCPM